MTWWTWRRMNKSVCSYLQTLTPISTKCVRQQIRSNLDYRLCEKGTYIKAKLNHCVVFFLIFLLLSFQSGGKRLWDLKTKKKNNNNIKNCKNKYLIIIGAKHNMNENYAFNVCVCVRLYGYQQLLWFNVKIFIAMLIKTLIMCLLSEYVTLENRSHVRKTKLINYFGMNEIIKK